MQAVGQQMRDPECPRCGARGYGRCPCYYTRDRTDEEIAAARAEFRAAFDEALSRLPARRTLAQGFIEPGALT